MLNRSFLEKDVDVWNTKDVSEFLLFNQCAAYHDVFLNQVIICFTFISLFVKKRYLGVSVTQLFC